MAKKKSPQDAELLEAMLIARRRDDQELLARIEQALDISTRQIPGGLLTVISDMEARAFFQEPANIMRLARFYVRHIDILPNELLALFFEVCPPSKFGMALSKATLARQKDDLRAADRKRRTDFLGDSGKHQTANREPEWEEWRKESQRIQEENRARLSKSELAKRIKKRLKATASIGTIRKRI